MTIDCAGYRERLSDLLDGALAPEVVRAMDAHAASCVGCAAERAAFETLIRDARALPPTPPERDLWAGIASRLEPRATATPAEPRVLVLGGRAPWWRRRLTLSLPQALAASLLLLALAGGASWLALRGAPGGRSLATAPAPGPATRDAGETATPVAAGSIDPRYDRTVADLQQVFGAERARLDTSTVRILDQNLAIIDRAVAEAKRAVDADPSNAYLRSHLAATMRRKVELLRKATVIAGTAG